MLKAKPDIQTLRPSDENGRYRVIRARRKDYARIVRPATYVKARSLPRQTLRLWLEEVARSLRDKRVRTILDLGCGTGRFTGPLARRFDAAAIGVDPSAAMLAQARRDVPESVVFRRGSAERIPLKNGQADVVFMSQAWHHLRDSARAAQELQRVIAPDGVVCIRNSTIENMGSYLYLRFFPGARQTCQRRLPRREGVMAVMKRAGFRLVVHRAVRQMIAPSPRAYLAKIRQKALFDVAELSDEESAFGFARLARHCRSRAADKAVFERIDLFAFRKRPRPRRRVSLHCQPHSGVPMRPTRDRPRFTASGVPATLLTSACTRVIIRPKVAGRPDDCLLTLFRKEQNEEAR